MQSMRLPIILSVVLIFTVLGSGCSSIAIKTNQFLGIPTYPPTDPATVEILPTEPGGAYERLGEIILLPSGDPARDELENKIKDAAAKLGANAVYIKDDGLRFIDNYPNVRWGDGYGFRDDRYAAPVYRRVITGVAIRYSSGKKQ